MPRIRHDPPRRDSEAVDFVVIGSGAAGGVMARELAQAGFDVVLMEQGPRFTAQDFEHDELKYWFNYGITNSPALSPQTFRKTPCDEARSRTPTRSCRSPTRAWSAAAACTSPPTFGAFTRSISANAACSARSRAALEDWPISYAELEPYYTKVDWDIGVSGLAGTHPNEPPRSRPYPMPPMPVKSSGVLLERGARALGAASLSGSARDRLAAVPRSRGLHPLRLLHGFWMRGRCEVLDAVHA